MFPCRQKKYGPFLSWTLKTTLLGASFLLGSHTLEAQGKDASAYDDYSAFESDPAELDEEVSRYFGRFFQSNFLIGTGLFTGELGKSNTAGFDLGLRFVFYFDKMWAGELTAGYFGHKSFYNADNTGVSGVDINLDTVMIPLSLGLRYGFDRDNLPRGIALMNPYLAAAAEIVFRSEGVKGVPKYGSGGSALSADLQSKFAPGAGINTTGAGFNLGGGFEFDVYKNKVFLGLDLRYHAIFWPDADVFIGGLGRSGHYVTVLGMATYNY